MKAMVLPEAGGPGALRLETVPDPAPGPGEVVVRVKAAALNHRDLFITKGQYGGLRFPIILGADGKVVGALTVLGFRPRVEHKVHTVFTEVVMRYAEYLTRQLGGTWPFPKVSAKAGE